MSTTEITQAQYEAVMGVNPSHFNGAERPVESIMWRDAAKFCNLLSIEAGLEPCYVDELLWTCDYRKNGFRLPTEAEWEYACKAGTQTKYHTGDTDSDLARAGWYEENSGSETHPVGMKESNAFGLFDMHGNVGEICNDWLGPYSSDNQTDPSGPSSRNDEDGRVLRGGNYQLNASLCRSSSRFGFEPLDESDWIGFRVVRRSVSISTYTVTGRIFLHELGIEGVEVIMDGHDKTNIATAVSDVDGYYNLVGVYDGPHTLIFYKNGYTFDHLKVDILVSGYDVTVEDIQADKSLTIGTELIMVPIPGGEFEMGDVEGVGDTDEKPIHTATVQDFEMSTYQITNAQYVTYLNDADDANEIAVTSTDVKGKGGNWTGQVYLYTDDSQIYYDNYVFIVDPEYDSWPVIVTWYGAKAFADHYGMDIPTETEWEYACRGGRQYMYGTVDGTIGVDKANYSDTGIGHTIAVGMYPPNPFNLYDMCGNMREWCDDRYSSKYGDVPYSTYRVMRGCTSTNSSFHCRASNRVGTYPAKIGTFCSFRVVQRY